MSDSARAPYGTKSVEEIFSCTLQGVEYLFNHGCELVILACNTASANALRKIQQEILPQKYPDKRVLGILVPTVEQIHDGTVGIFATVGTVKSNAYTREIIKRYPSAKVFEIACPNLGWFIESGEGEEVIEKEIKDGIDALKQVMGESFPPKDVLLGCTHYPLVHHVFARHLPETVHVYDQGSMTALSLKNYLLRHPEIDVKLDKKGTRTFLTTGNVQNVQNKASAFYGKTAPFEQCELVAVADEKSLKTAMKLLDEYRADFKILADK